MGAGRFTAQELICSSNVSQKPQSCISSVRLKKPLVYAEGNLMETSGAVLFLFLGLFFSPPNYNGNEEWQEIKTYI